MAGGIDCKLVVVRKETVDLCEERCGAPLPPAWDFRERLCADLEFALVQGKPWRERKTKAAAEAERKFRQDLLNAVGTVAKSVERMEHLLAAFLEVEQRRRPMRDLSGAAPSPLTAEAPRPDGEVRSEENLAEDCGERLRDFVATL